MEKITYEIASVSDIDALVGLLNELFTIEVDFTPNLVKQKLGLELLLKNHSNATIQVAKNSSKKIVGLVTAQLVISTAQGAKSAWIEDMIISQDYRNLGIGKTLLQSALDWAKEKGATRAQLLVDIENEPAIGYYHHLGWESTQLQARRIFLS